MTTKKKENSDLLEALKEIGHFDIGWAKFPFIFKKGAINADGAECLGAVDFDALEIHISSSLKQDVLQHTTSHECWHVLMSTLGIRTNDEDCEKELSISNEFIVEQIARGMKIFRKLNPGLWILLYEDSYE